MHLPPAIQAIQTALDQGQAALARDLMLGLSDADRRALELLLGVEATRRAYRSVRRGTRGIKRGRVVILPGITGSELQAVYRDGKRRLLWVDLFNIIRGKSLELMTLTPAGGSADPSVQILPCGLMLRWYLNLVTALQNEWDVLSAPYDWRLDIDQSADALATRIEQWAKGEPVHLVAHSMGGLVSRRMIQLHPDLWRAMDDPNGRRRGGRLVMLGTPNRGSYSIPLTLTGSEFMVSLLDLADMTKGKNAVLSRLNTFPGSYQMLPSPEVRTDIGGTEDDHRRLFDPAVWGKVPILPALLDRAARFARDLHGVVDPERMVYLAGYGQGTPSAIKVRAPGKFQYRRTSLGDGRVPHTLGLLPGVPAYYVQEAHGDLPKNEQIIQAMTDLLLTGGTKQLETSPRLVRGVRGVEGAVSPESEDWHDPEAFVDQAAVEEFRLQLKSQRRAVKPTEALLKGEVVLSDAAVSPMGETRQPGKAEPKAGAKPGRGAGRQPKTIRLRIEVVWGDITKVKSDVCAVGHYQGVEPQNAELAIDRFLASAPEHSSCQRGDDRLVLTRLTHRGVIRGVLGQIAFFPSAHAMKRGGLPRTIAVAGMGYPGTFSRSGLQNLSAQLADAVSTLPQTEVLSMVLIGSGEGSLSVREALGGIVGGLDQWADSESRDDRGPARRGLRSSLRRIRIVERTLGKARNIDAELRKLVDDRKGARTSLVLESAPRLVVAKEGREIDPEFAAALVIVTGALDRSRVSAALRRADPAGRIAKPADQVITALSKVRKTAEEYEATPLAAADWLWRRITVSEDRETSRTFTRLSFLRGDAGVRLAAITNSATVSERAIAVDFGLIREQIAVMQAEEDPVRADVNRVARLVYRLLIPRDFQSLLVQSESVVFDVDRAMAAVPWEVMQCAPSVAWADRVGDGPEEPPAPRHLAIEKQVARQLRTTLSPAPQPDVEPTGPIEALVICDPDDSLEHAREEGRAVARTLAGLGCAVRLLVGSRGDSADRAATRSTVIDLLSARRRPLDILHYAGHGDLDRQDPTRVGWVFADGILGPNELRLALSELPPLMVLSNSCLTGVLSETAVGGSSDRLSWDEFGLIPGLADIFLQRGVRHFIAANRPVYDQGAQDFAQVFYRSLLQPSPLGSTVGVAVKAAREALEKQESLYGPLWAAYHHYGDPLARLRRTTSDPQSGATRSRRDRRR